MSYVCLCWLGVSVCVCLFVVDCVCLYLNYVAEVLSFVCYGVCVCRVAFGCLFVWCLLLPVMMCLVEVCVCWMFDMMAVFVGLRLSVCLVFVCDVWLCLRCVIEVFV